MTQAEFLDREEVREARHEFDGVRPVATTGGSGNRFRIIVDIAAASDRSPHRDGRCEALVDAGVETKGKAVRYPDAGDRRGLRRARQAGAGAGDRVRGGRPLVGARGQKPRAGRRRGRAVDPARRDRRADGDRAHGAVARARRALALPDAQGRRHAGAARDRRRDRGRQPVCAGEPRRRRHPTRRRSSAGTPRPGATRQPP